MELKQYIAKLNQFKGQHNNIKSLLEEEQTNNDKLSQNYLDAELARDIILLVAKQTQDKLSFKIENLVTAALEYTHEDPYKFKVEIDQKNNQTQCNMYFEKDGFKTNPMKDNEGTILDIASIALRIATWSLKINRTSPVFILDEPSRNVSAGYKELTSNFIKEICDKLCLQCITISHDPSVIGKSDTVIKVVKEKGVSRIES